MPKRAVFVIAYRSFRDEELLEPRAILAAAGVSVAVASSALGPAHGMLGARLEPDLLYTAIRPGELDALIFVGGEGSQEFWEDRAAQRLARAAVSGGIVLGAICFAPSILANAGLLEGRRATAAPTRRPHLVSRGALFSSEPVVRDGKLVTADGPGSARAFGEALAALLVGAA